MSDFFWDFNHKYTIFNLNAKCTLKIFTFVISDQDREEEDITEYFSSEKKQILSTSLRLV